MVEEPKEEKTVEIKSVAEAIVDLCYNYVVEDSIYNVSKDMLMKNS